jgi:signal transduction histidine kinase
MRVAERASFFLLDFRGLGAQMPPQAKMKARSASQPENSPDQPASGQTSAAKIPPEINARLRTLAHDLSNAIETVMQASYLLAQAKLDDTNAKWLGLIDQAVRDAARINREIRDILRSQ